MAYSLSLGALTLEPVTKKEQMEPNSTETERTTFVEAEFKPRSSRGENNLRDLEQSKRQVIVSETLSSTASSNYELAASDGDGGGIILVPNQSRSNLITLALSCMETRRITSDLIVHVEDSTYSTHKIILYVQSGYFANVFRRYKDEVIRCITLKQIKNRAFGPIYEYMYSGEIKVNTHNLDDVLKLANTLDMPDLYNALLKFQESSFREYEQKQSKKTNRTDSSERSVPLTKSTRMPHPPREDQKLEGQQSILLFGGRDPIHPNNNDEADGMKIYRLVRGKDVWQITRTSPVPFDHASIQVIDETVYICGGWTSKTSHKLRASTEMWSYDPREDRWKQLANMAHSRVHHASVAIEGRIYVVGGTDGHDKIFSTVERYDPVTNRWSTVAPFPLPCLGMAATSYKNEIWACGGLRQTSKHNCGTPTDVTYIYSPHEDVWRVGPRLRIPRAFASLIVVSNQMYLVGGIGAIKSKKNVAQSISDIDIYHQKNQSWNHWTDMFEPRHCFGTVAIGADLYVVGGMSSAIGDVIASVERFDTVQRKCFIDVQLPIGLAGMGCVYVENGISELQLGTAQHI